MAEAEAELESGDAPPLSVKVTREEQQKDPELERKRKVLDGSVRLSAARASAITDSWELHADKLYRHTFTDGGEDVRALAVPSHMRAAILALHHYPLSTGGGHRGGRQLYDAIRTSYYWKGMERHCHVCSPTRASNVPRLGRSRMSVLQWGRRRPRSSHSRSSTSTTRVLSSGSVTTCTY